MRILFSLILWLFFPIISFSQSSILEKEQQLIMLLKEANSDSMYNYRIENKIDWNKENIELALKEILLDENSFNYTFPNLARNGTLHIFTFKEKSIRVIDFTSFLERAPMGNYNSITFVQYKDTVTGIKIFDLCESKELYAEGAFYQKILFSIDNVFQISSSSLTSLLFKCSQGFIDETTNNSNKKTAFFILNYNGDSIQFDSTIYNNKNLICITNENADNDLLISFDADSVPQLNLVFPVDKYYQQNSFKNDKNNPTIVEEILRYDGRTFNKVIKRKYLIKPDGSEIYTNFSIDSLIKDFKRNLKIVKNYNVWNDEESDIDIELASHECCLELVAILNNSNYNEKFHYDQLSIDSITCFENPSIKIYSFQYYSGGTRGDISNQVIQWKSKNGEIHAEVLAEGAGFNKIIPLLSNDKDELYLLLGSETASTSTYVNTAYVLNFFNDSLIHDYPAFVDRSSIEIYNTDFNFSTIEQTLLFSTENYQLYFNDTKDPEAIKVNQKIKRALECDDCTQIKLVFDGTKFIY